MMLMAQKQEKAIKRNLSAKKKRPQSAKIKTKKKKQAAKGIFMNNFFPALEN